MKISIDNRSRHRFNHLERPISKSKRYFDRTVRLLVVGRQKGVTATRNGSKNSIEIYPYLAHRCTTITFYIIQHNWLSLNYNLVDLSLPEALETFARELVSLLTPRPQLLSPQNCTWKIFIKSISTFWQNIRLSFVKLAPATVFP